MLWWRQICKAADYSGTRKACCNSPAPKQNKILLLNDCSTASQPVHVIDTEAMSITGNEVYCRSLSYWLLI